MFEEFQRKRDNFEPKLGDLAALLRCRVNADSQVWTKRFASLKNQAQLAEEQDILGQEQGGHAHGTFYNPSGVPAKVKQQPMHLL